MFDSIKYYVLGGFAAVILAGYGVLGFEVHHWKSIASTRQTELNQSISNFNQLYNNYKNAQVQADLKQIANLNRVKAENAIKDERIANDYQVRIDAVTRELDRLRTSSGSTPGNGSPKPAPVPGVPATPIAVDPTTCRNELLTLHCRATATYQAIQLDELNKWVQQTQQINPNTAPAP